MLLWCIAGLFMSIYFIISNSYIPLQIQPHLFSILCSVAWVQSMYYPPYSYKMKNILFQIITYYLLWIGFEVGFVIWLRPLYSKGTTWPNLIFGIIATVFICIGLLPPYWELAKRNGRVMGINFLFLFMDSSGSIFNLASMCIGEFDPMGMTMYVVVLALEIGLFLSQGIWLLRFGKKLKEENNDTNPDDAGKSNDDDDLENNNSSIQENIGNDTGDNNIETIHEKDVDIYNWNENSEIAKITSNVLHDTESES